MALLPRQAKTGMVMFSKILSIVFLSLLIPVLVSAQGGKLEQVGAFSDPSASESVKGVLEDRGFRVVLADGTPFCDIWLRKSLPLRSKADVPGAIYTEVPESAFIGVISFPKQTTDFRGQAVRAGAYSLRYSLHPTDGNHMGISPIRDFLLLVPVAADNDVNAQIKFEDLMKLSAKTGGANHPAPLSLVSSEGISSVPGVSQNDHGHIVFAAKIKTATGAEMPLAFIVKGIAEQ
jgi:hypothetical protein